jgi:hypothetical protein
MGDQLVEGIVGPIRIPAAVAGAATMADQSLIAVHEDRVVLDFLVSQAPDAELATAGPLPGSN